MSFHVVIHPRPDGLCSQRDVHIGDRTLPALSLPNETSQPPFSLSFEEAVARLRQLPRMFVEPDGSFVWVPAGSGERYQLDGSLCDNGTRLLHVELKGNCDGTTFDTFLQVLGWPEQAVMFQLVRDGIYLAEDEFRQLAFDQ